MADISKLKIKDTLYNIKDTAARSLIPTKTSQLYNDSGFNKETKITWGGGSLTGEVGPIGCALSSEHSANRLAYINPKAIKCEYSNDGGTTWVDFGSAYDDIAKTQLFINRSILSVGTVTPVTLNNKTRITIEARDTTSNYVYIQIRKLLINVSTEGQREIMCDIETRTGANTAWGARGTYRLKGWSGWNDLDFSLSVFGGYVNQIYQPWAMRLTFYLTDINDNYKNRLPVICSIRAFGDNCWTAPSILARTGHLYSYDANQNATFPANIYANTFNGHTIKADVPENAKFTDTLTTLDVSDETIIVNQ